MSHKNLPRDIIDILNHHASIDILSESICHFYKSNKYIFDPRIIEKKLPEIRFAESVTALSETSQTSKIRKNFFLKLFTLTYKKYPELFI